jgi:GNAT superfamily N-acetyltransferase
VSDVRLRTAAEVDADALHAFLARFFGDAKAGFLRRHGTWWHGGEVNRLVLLAGGEVAAYCGVIPVRVAIDGGVHDALWWIDLVVAPEFRGRGLQALFDREVRARAPLLLGFPNELAAAIHRKHGWGVREDLRAVLAPLDPRRLNAVRRAGVAVRLAAGALSPFAWLWRRRLAAWRPRTARRVDAPDVERWAELARVGSAGLATTWRDAAYLRRRYVDAPYRDQLLFYETGSIVAVSRRLERGGRVEERVLDLFGDLARRDELDDLLRTILGEAVRAGAAQVTGLAAYDELAAAFRRSGFRLGSVARFCWSSLDREVMEALARARFHWCLGDSDNDDPL